MRRGILLVVGVLLAAVTVTGQTQNPTTVRFKCSTSHDAVYADGSPLVSRYYLYLYKTSAPTTSVKSLDLGKPTCDAQGYISRNVLTTLAPLTQGTVHVAKIGVIGPAGTILSAASNTFLPPVAPSAATEVSIQ